MSSDRISRESSECNYSHLVRNNTSDRADGCVDDLRDPPRFDDYQSGKTIEQMMDEDRVPLRVETLTELSCHDSFAENALDDLAESDAVRFDDGAGLLRETWVKSVHTWGMFCDHCTVAYDVVQLTCWRAYCSEHRLKGAETLDAVSLNCRSNDGIDIREVVVNSLTYHACSSGYGAHRYSSNTMLGDQLQSSLRDPILDGIVLASGAWVRVIHVHLDLR